MAWKYVQYENGKMRTNEGGGGGGSSTFAGLDDVSFNNIQNGQVPKYNSTTQKWENADESGGGGTVTDVEVDGVSVVNQQGVAEITMPTPPTIPVIDVKVNGTSVVDANKEAQIKSYKEVTQAEYNALPASKTSDGILYCIKDVGGADGFPPLIYSPEEREVGVWTDGKPLYQKTFHITNLPNQTMVDEPHGISNIGDIIDTRGVCHVKLSIDATNTFTPLPRIQDNNQANQLLAIDVNNTNIRLKGRGFDFPYVFDYVNVTIQYTKTTDTAGSGTWNTDGAYAHHYSSNEKVVGTWIDGKPLYEKTVYLSSLSYDSNWHSVAHNISNIKRIVDCSCIGSNNSGEFFNMPNYRPTLTQGIVISITTTNINYLNNWQDAAVDAYVTIRYTKTTD